MRSIRWTSSRDAVEPGAGPALGEDALNVVQGFILPQVAWKADKIRGEELLVPLPHLDGRCRDVNQECSEEEADMGG